MVANMIVSIRLVDTNVPVKLVTSYIPTANIAKVKSDDSGKSEKFVLSN